MWLKAADASFPYFGLNILLPYEIIKNWLAPSTLAFLNEKNQSIIGLNGMWMNLLSEYLFSSKAYFLKICYFNNPLK